jgi:hypothetical protein
VRGERGHGKGSVDVETYLYLQKVLGWAVDLLEALLARIWHRLHDCEWRHTSWFCLKGFRFGRLMNRFEAFSAGESVWSCEVHSEVKMSSELPPPLRLEIGRSRDYILAYLLCYAVLLTPL